MTGGALVIGYGNSLRTDDGVGRYAAERLASDARLAGATVLQVHQLAPELALDIGRSGVVVFVDAGTGPAAGTFTVSELGRDSVPAPTWSHHLDPSSLVALAGELYGAAPAAWVVTVGVESLEAGDRLSPAVEAALPRIVDAVADLATGAVAGAGSGRA